MRHQNIINWLQKNVNRSSWKISVCMIHPESWRRIIDMWCQVWLKIGILHRKLYSKNSKIRYFMVYRSKRKSKKRARPPFESTLRTPRSGIGSKQGHNRLEGRVMSSSPDYNRKGKDQYNFTSQAKHNNISHSKRHLKVIINLLIW